ncbi:MAG: hypothetical protein LLF84_03420 [Methanoregulaceae archaeon]|nr:hypothetical protein [Methanoregulaceae archaeon]
MRFSWQLKLGLALVSFSIAVYSIKFLVLKNPTDTLNYVFNSLGFLPISAFLVTIILNELLTMRSRRERLEKLNMVIGTFFSEVGTTLLAGISDCDPGLDGIRKQLLIQDTWQDQEFEDLKGFLEAYRYEVDISKIDIRNLTTFLHEKRNFLLRLLENPVLLEHQMFTETLRAVFHLTEELERRSGAGKLPDTDLSHINGDLVRVYRNLSIQWVDYMKYLKKNYPYLFSLAMRTNPFDQEASVIVRK